MRRITTGPAAEVPLMSRGRLYLVPSLLGATKPADVLPQRTIDVARDLRHYVVENAKPARQFLKALEPGRPLQAISMVEIGRSASRERCAELLAPALAGEPLGMLSDAGCPGVADPGAALVEAAHAAGIVVVPLVGPSSLLLALMGSGMNGQGFVFHGYLPVPPQARGAALRHLEAASARDGQAQLFIETPYRNEAMLRAKPRGRRVARARVRALREASGDLHPAGTMRQTSSRLRSPVLGHPQRRMYASSCLMMNSCWEIVSLTRSPIETMPTIFPPASSTGRCRTRLLVISAMPSSTVTSGWT